MSKLLISNTESSYLYLYNLFSLLSAISYIQSLYEDEGLNIHGLVNLNLYTLHFVMTGKQISNIVAVSHFQSFSSRKPWPQTWRN